MKVALLAIGNRGDIQPSLALAIRFQNVGNEVLMIGNQDVAHYAGALGIPFVASYPLIQADMLVIQKGIIGKEMNHVKYIKSMNQVQSNFLAAACKASLKNLEDFQPTVILCNPMMETLAFAVGAKLNVPVIPLNSQNRLPTRETQSPMKEKYWHYFGWAFSLYHSQRLKKRQNRIIRKALAIPKEQPLHGDTFQAFMNDQMYPIVPAMAGCSTSYVKQPTDLQGSYGKSVIYTGPWTVPLENELKAKEIFGNWNNIQVFLNQDADNAPICIGWGSMTATKSHKEVTSLAIKTLKRLGARGIIIGEQLSEDHLDDPDLLDYATCGKVLFVRHAPHQYLFPRCAAVIHHGGSGTLAATMAAGVPSIVTPMLEEQYHNARQLQTSGAGIAMPNFTGTSSLDLAIALRKILVEPSFGKNAKRMAHVMKRQDGAGMVVAIVEKFTKEQVETGIWEKRSNQREMDRRKARRNSIVFFVCMLMFDMFPRPPQKQLPPPKRSDDFKSIEGTNAKGETNANRTESGG